MRRFLAIATVSALALTACGGGSDDAESPTTEGTATETDAPTETEAAPVETEAPTETEAAPVETEAGPAETEVAGDPEAAAGTVDVALVEWAVETPFEVAAGAVTFNVTNSGNFPHHFAIARGDSYETLPQSEGGAIDEDALGADFLGRTSNIASGAAETIEFDLEPGNYVFFCNIAGTVSHAAQGQVLSVTVS